MLAIKDSNKYFILKGKNKRLKYKLLELFEIFTDN